MVKLALIDTLVETKKYKSFKKLRPIFVWGGIFFIFSIFGFLLYTVGERTTFPYMFLFNAKGIANFFEYLELAAKPAILTTIAFTAIIFIIKLFFSVIAALFVWEQATPKDDSFVYVVDTKQQGD